LGTRPKGPCSHEKWGATTPRRHLIEENPERQPCHHWNFRADGLPNALAGVIHQVGVDVLGGADALVAKELADGCDVMVFTRFLRLNVNVIVLGTPVAAEQTSSSFYLPRLVLRATFQGIWGPGFG
jgi:hypothetical protein